MIRTQPVGRSRVWQGCRWLLGLAAAAIGAAAYAADESPIITERPGFTSSPVVIAPGSVQFEGGYQYTEDDTDVQTYPLALLRFGLVESLELQLNWAGISRAEEDNSSSTGANDLGVGLKWQLTDSDADLLMSLLASVSVPVGAEEFTTNSFDPSVSLFWSYNWAVDLAGGVVVSRTDGDNVLTTSWRINQALPANTGTYLEYVGSFTDAGGPTHSLNTGLTWLPRSNIQLDINGGVGLNDRADDYFVGAGAAYRF